MCVTHMCVTSICYFMCVTYAHTNMQNQRYYVWEVPNNFYSFSYETDTCMISWRRMHVYKRTFAL